MSPAVGGCLRRSETIQRGPRHRAQSVLVYRRLFPGEAGYSPKQSGIVIADAVCPCRWPALEAPEKFLDGSDTENDSQYH
jgi:hypothetical protein